MKKGAIISECGLYRYALTRQWSHGPAAVFIMLNPSTADASIDDRTIRRCISFSKEAGLSGIRVENLFAYRATKPDVMFSSGEDIVGNSDEYIRKAVTCAGGPVIAAWGADKRAASRAEEVHNILRGMGKQLYCLGETKSGAPRHPLYVRGDQSFIPLTEEPS